MRKHENFHWSGYKYAPESVEFFINGKHINFSEEVRSRLACLAVCGESEKLLIELKRALRAEEKKSRVVGKCICFFKKDSNEFYYTQQLRYNPDDLYDALRCYKEWKTSVYKGYKQDKIEMRGDRAEMSDFPLYLNTVAGGLDCRDREYPKVCVNLQTDVR